MRVFRIEMGKWGDAAMGWSTDVERNERFVPAGSWAPLVLATVGLAVLFCSTWAARNPATEVSAAELFIARFSMMAAFLGLAIAFRGHGAAYKPLAAFAAIFLLTHVLAGSLVGAFDPASSEHFVLAGISAVFEGFGIALLELVLLIMVARFKPWVSALAVAFAYLLADLLYCLLLFASPAVVAASLPLGEVAALAAAWALLVRPSLSLPLPEGDEELAERAADDANPAEAPVMLGGVGLGPAMVFVTLLAFVWGIVAELSGGGTIAFFDTTSEFVVIGVRLVLLAFCLFAGTTFGFGTVAGVCSLCWSAGILVLMLAGNVFGAAVGGVVVKAGLYGLQVLMLVLAARYVGMHPARGVFVMGVVSFALLGGQVSRFGCYLTEVIPGFQLEESVLLAWAWWCLVMAAVAAIGGLAAAAHRSRAHAGGAEAAAVEDERAEGASEGAAVLPAHDSTVPFLLGDSPLRQRGIEFCLKFEEFCEAKSLSDRERDVLFEALHGRTVEGVAEVLFLSRDTVKTYLSRAYARAGVNNKQAVLRLIDEWELKE
ncbi:helix-turn-helix transcriptional regulator [uncultured Adlercreutzia sp.]|uniref:helix-turn-helix transcriptional regulator n=1 Tax=uncultured Adlercreutzia sp. TaxID=875803 RepID=UPI0025F9D24D|nr:helix-turn-helix transcriptional regulator [uncultured Adlercreutzia sp.]